MDCPCGNPEGSNPECERCRLIAQRDVLLDALRELHDFSDRINYGKYVLRSQLAAEAAAEILKRYGK